MELEEREGVEHPGDRCEACGAPLTPDEKREILLNGGPALCKIHAAEQVPADEDAEIEAP